MDEYDPPTIDDVLRYRLILLGVAPLLRILAGHAVDEGEAEAESAELR